MMDFWTEDNGQMFCFLNLNAIFIIGQLHQASGDNSEPFEFLPPNFMYEAIKIAHLLMPFFSNISYYQKAIK
jgi:hypothetical protein